MQYDTWFPTVSLLDYFLRMFCLTPIDVLYSHQKQSSAGHDFGRMCLVCKATEAPENRDLEVQMQASALNFEYNVLWRRELEPSKPYSPLAAGYRPIFGGNSLLSSTLQQKAMTISPELARLKLSDSD